MNWSVDGEYITDMARHWLWDEGKPYEKAEELLLSCMLTDQLSENERKDIAREILEGRKKLVGNGTLTLEDDGEEIRPLSDLVKRLYADTEKLKEQNEQLNVLLKESVDCIDTQRDTIQNFKREESIKKVKRVMKNSNMVLPLDMALYDLKPDDLSTFCDEYGLELYEQRWGHDTWYAFGQDGKICLRNDLVEIGIFPPIEESLTEVNFEGTDKYKEEKVDASLGWGWLSPHGEFTESDLGDHERSAVEIIEENNWQDEFEYWDPDYLALGRDFLIQVKGYALLHNPSGLPYTIVSHEKPFTKEQKDFLFDYFIAEGDGHRAKALFA